MSGWRLSASAMSRLLLIVAALVAYAAAATPVFGSSDVAENRVLSLPRNTQVGSTDNTVTISHFFKGRYRGTPLSSGDLVAIRVPNDLLTTSTACSFTFGGSSVPLTPAALATVSGVTPVSSSKPYNLAYTVGAAASLASEAVSATDDRIFVIDCVFTAPSKKILPSMVHVAIATPGTTPVVRAATAWNLPTPEIQGLLREGPPLTFNGRPSVKQVVELSVAFKLAAAVTNTPVLQIQVPRGFVLAQTVVNGSSVSGLTMTVANSTLTARFPASYIITTGLTTLRFIGALGSKEQPAYTDGLFVLFNSQTCRMTEETGPGSCNMADPLGSRDENLIFSRSLSLPAITADVDNYGLDSSEALVAFPSTSSMTLTITPFGLQLPLENFASQLHLSVALPNATIMYPVDTTPQCVIANSTTTVSASMTSIQEMRLALTSDLYSTATSLKSLSIVCTVGSESSVNSYINADSVGVRLSIIYISDGTTLITHYAATTGRAASEVTAIPDYDGVTVLHQLLIGLAGGTSLSTGAEMTLTGEIVFPASHPLPSRLQYTIDVPSAGVLSNASCSMAVNSSDIYNSSTFTFYPQAFNGGGMVSIVFKASTLNMQLPSVDVKHTFGCLGILSPARIYSSSSAATPLFHGRFSEYELGGGTAVDLRLTARVSMAIMGTVQAFAVEENIFTVTFANSSPVSAVSTDDIVFAINTTALPPIFYPGSALEVYMPLGYTTPGLSRAGRDSLGNTCFVNIAHASTVNATGLTVVANMPLSADDMYFQPLSEVPATDTVYAVRLRFPDSLTAAFVQGDMVSFRCTFNLPDAADTTGKYIEARVLNRFTPGFGPAHLSVYNAATGFVAATESFQSTAQLSLPAVPSGTPLGYLAGTGPMRSIVRSTPYVGAFGTVDLDLRPITALIGGIRLYSTAAERFELLLPDSFVYLPYTHCGVAWNNGDHSVISANLSNHFRFGVASPQMSAAPRLFVGVPEDGVAIMPDGFFHMRCLTQNPLLPEPDYRGMSATFHLVSDPVSTLNSVRFNGTQVADFLPRNNTLSYVNFTEFGIAGGVLVFTVTPNAFTMENYRLHLAVPELTVITYVAANSTVAPTPDASWIECSVDKGTFTAAAALGFSSALDLLAPPTEVDTIVVSLQSRVFHWPQDIIEVVCRASANATAPVIYLPRELITAAPLPEVSATLHSAPPLSALISGVLVEQAGDPGVAVQPVSLVYDTAMTRVVTAADYNSTNWVSFELSALGFELPLYSTFEFRLPRGGTNYSATFAVPRNLTRIPCTFTVGNVSIPLSSGDISLTHPAGLSYSVLKFFTGSSVPARASVTTGGSDAADLYHIECLMLHPTATIDPMNMHALVYAGQAPLHKFLDIPDVLFKGVFHMIDPDPVPASATTLTTTMKSQFTLTTLTITLNDIGVDMLLYDEIEIEFPTTHLYEFRPSQHGTEHEVSPFPPEQASNGSYVAPALATLSLEDSAGSGTRATVRSRPTGTGGAKQRGDRAGRSVPRALRRREALAHSVDRSAGSAPRLQRMLTAALPAPYDGDSDFDEDYNYTGGYSGASVGASTLAAEVVLPVAQTSPCTVNGEPALYTVPLREDHITNTASTCAVSDDVCSTRTLIVALPFDLYRSEITNKSSAVIVCQNVRTPLATPIVAGVGPQAASAKFRLTRPSYTSRSNYSKPLLMAYQSAVSLQALVVPEWGDSARTATPANVTAGSEHNVLTLALEPMPVNMTSESVITTVLPMLWSMINVASGSSRENATCAASVDNAIRTQADITGRTAMDNTLRTITFRPATAVAATNLTFRIFCDDVRVPSIVRPAEATTTMRVNDYVAQYGNNAPTTADYANATFARRWLLTAETTRVSTSAIIAGLADREFVSHTLAIELRLPLNTTMMDKYVSAYMGVLSPYATEANLIFTASIRRNVLVKVPKVIDDPQVIEYDQYINVEIVFEGTSNTNNFDVLQLLINHRLRVAAAVTTLTGAFIIKNNEPVIAGVPGTCFNSQVDVGESDRDCGSECMACSLNSACSVDADCLTSYCSKSLCAERTLVAETGTDVTGGQVSAAPRGAALGALSWALAAVATAAALFVLG